VPGDFGWADVGDFQTLGDVLAGGDGADEDENVVLDDAKKSPVVLRDTQRSVVIAHSGRLVATLGVRDLVVVDTPDALLICGRDRAQDVKSVVDELKTLGEDRFL